MVLAITRACIVPPVGRLCPRCGRSRVSSGSGQPSHGATCKTRLSMPKLSTACMDRTASGVTGPTWASLPAHAPAMSLSSTSTSTSRTQPASGGRRCCRPIATGSSRLRLSRSRAGVACSCSSVRRKTGRRPPTRQPRGSTSGGRVASPCCHLAPTRAATATPGHQDGHRAQWTCRRLLGG